MQTFTFIDATNWRSKPEFSICCWESTDAKPGFWSADCIVTKTPYISEGVQLKPLLFKG